MRCSTLGRLLSMRCVRPYRSTRAPALAYEHRSAVYYHCNAPLFDESLAVVLPSQAQFESSHLRLELWHASSTEANSHCFAFAFLPLADVAGAALRDGRHRLRVYRPPSAGFSTSPTGYAA